MSDGATTPPRNTTTDRLREARTALGLTQQDTATALGIHRSAVAALESGIRKLSGAELLLVERLYRRPSRWLLGEDPDPPVSDELTAAIQGLPLETQRKVLDFVRFLVHQEVTR